MPCNTPALVLLHTLTNARRMWEAGFPLICEASQAPFRLPKSWKKSCRIFCCQRPCPRSARQKAFAYWQVCNVRESVRPRRLHRAGERCKPAFFISQICEVSHD